MIKELVTKENSSGVSPIKKALKMVYTEKQIDTVKFLIDKGNLVFAEDLEDAVINHVLDIFKFSDTKKFLEIKSYILKLKDKFKN